MKPAHRSTEQSFAKVATGIAGFDQVTRSELPRGRPTLLVGGPGSGKTTLALQLLTFGGREFDEPGISVAFKETATRIVVNTEGFGWHLAKLRRKVPLSLDAQPPADQVLSETFDLDGMLAAPIIDAPRPERRVASQ